MFILPGKHLRIFGALRTLLGLGVGWKWRVESDSFAKSVFFQSLIESWEIIETSVED